MFGSTVEYILRKCKDPKFSANIANNGSMHLFEKSGHSTSIKEIEQYNCNGFDNCQVATPIYPMQDAHFPEIVKSILKNSNNLKNILIHAADLNSAEINMLFQYYKVSNSVNKRGLGIFFNSSANNLTNWNKDYTHWSQAQPWELREWFSLFYPTWVQEWIDSQYQVDDSWLHIKNTDILYNPVDQFKKIINFCDLSEFDGIDLFAANWQTAQQYIIDEFNLLDSIVDHTINNLPFSWNSLNIIAESIVQQRLRSNGYEIRCDGLNTFPTDSRTLYNLLEKV